MSEPIRLRDVVEFRNCYFSVVSYFNDRAVKCLLRYVPETIFREVTGKKPERSKRRKGYVKLDHEEALNFFREYEKDGIFLLPVKVKVFKPEAVTPALIKKDETVRKVYEFFSAPVKGVTGSRLIGLNAPTSDVDFVVYGKWFEIARRELKEGIEKGKLRKLEDDEWKKIYRKRNPPFDFDTFVLHEERKYNRAMVDVCDIYFDLLYVRDYRELHKYPEFRGKKVGKVVVEGTVTDDSAIFDYPARYPLKDVKIKYISTSEDVGECEVGEVLSFTHTYAGQAFRGERIEAYGVLEVHPESSGVAGKVIVGTRRVSDEYIISKTLLGL